MTYLTATERQARQKLEVVSKEHLQKTSFVVTIPAARCARTLESKDRFPKIRL